LSTSAPLTLPENPRLVENITWFARALRAAGLRVGPGAVMRAVEAIQAVGFTSRQDFYWALHCCFVTRPEERVLFAQCFRLFWRDPRYVEHMMAMLLPSMRGVQEARAAKPAEKRAAEGLLDGVNRETPETEESGTEVEFDATLTMTDRERLKTLDFEQMSASEMAQAKRLISAMRLPLKPLTSRRMGANPRGDIADWRATMRVALRQGGDIGTLAKKKRKTRLPDLVVLCDISGSMAPYSRAVLQFVHAISNRPGAERINAHCLTFGTRLTNITRHMRARDVDQALMLAGAEAQDWEGGTRIGHCLRDFNKLWARRLLGRGAVVLLITDGLDRGDTVELAKEMQRLNLSARRLIWLNPLLRWDGFAAKAQGIRAILPHVDSFRAGHNIASFEGLIAALSSVEDGGEKARLMADVQNAK